MSLQPIILDTDKTAPFYELPLKIRQGDTGDELQVTLGKSFQKYTDLSTVDIELIAKTPDQRLIKQPVTDKSGNTFKVKFPDEMYTNVGVFRNMYFKIGDDSTSSVKLVVLQGIGSIKEAGSYIDDFETLIKEAESYVLALKDFADTGNSTIDNKVAELTGKMQSFVDQAQKDLNAAKSAWSTFQSSSQTAFTDAQNKRASDFNSQKAGFETDFNKQKTDFENRFKALLTTLQSDYDDFKALINKDVADFNTSLDSLDAQATDVKNKFDALKAQLDLAAQNVTGVRTNLYTDTRDFDNPSAWDNGNNWSNWHKTGEKFNGLTVMTTDSNWTGLAQPIQAKKGETYVYSVYARYKSGTGTSMMFFNVNGTDTGNVISLNETWQRVTKTITLNEDALLRARIDRTDNNTNTLLIAGPKLEKGSVATDWCPNPTEIVTTKQLQTSAVGTNLLVNSNFSSGLDHWIVNIGDNADCKAVVTTDSDGDTCVHITGTGGSSGIWQTTVKFGQNQITTGSMLAKGIGKLSRAGFASAKNSNFGTVSTESYSKIGTTSQTVSDTNTFCIYFNPFNGVIDVYIKFVKLEKGSTATDYSLNPLEISTSGDIQTSIKNALDKADYPTNAEVDSKISTGVGQAKTYAEQSIKDIIGAAPDTLDTIAELADAVTKNKDGVQAINDGITKKADKTDVTALQNTVQTMITPISQEDYDALVSAGTVDPKILYVIPDA